MTEMYRFGVPLTCSSESTSYEGAPSHSSGVTSTFEWSLSKTAKAVACSVSDLLRRWYNYVR